MSRRLYRPRRPAGFTFIEIMMVVGIVALLLSLLVPVLGKAQSQARRVQCSEQLRGIGQALAMYDFDYDSSEEAYPGRVTNLYTDINPTSGANRLVGYVNNSRVFICPMDVTKATKNKAGRPSLKPGTPMDDKSDWAERAYNPTEQNCSYLYEFSTRHCQDLEDDFGWAANCLVNFDPDLAMYNALWSDWNYPDIMSDLDRDGDGAITWQEAKFWQLREGDVYGTGCDDSSSNPSYIPTPPDDFEEPYDYYWDNFLAAPRGYARNWLPILRCFWHMDSNIPEDKQEGVMNLAIDGNIFNSEPFWERSAFKYGKAVGEQEAW